MKQDLKRGKLNCDAVLIFLGSYGPEMSLRSCPELRQGPGLCTSQGPDIDVGFPRKEGMFLGEDAFFSSGQFLGRCQL